MGRPKSQRRQSELGKEIRRRRKQLGLSQEELGALIGPDGLSRKSVGDIERGQTHQPSDAVLDAIEKHLNISRQRAFELMAKVPGIDMADVEAVIDRAADEADMKTLLHYWRSLSDRTQTGIKNMLAAALAGNGVQEPGANEE